MISFSVFSMYFWAVVYSFYKNLAEGFQGASAAQGSQGATKHEFNA